MKHISIYFFALILFFIGNTSAFSSDLDVWKETHTAHFMFIFKERDVDAVSELTAFCEDVYGQVGDYFNYHPDEVRCVVLGDIDMANGSYSAPPHHLELYVRAPVNPWMGARGPGWLRLLLTHELTHYFDMASDSGFFYALSLILGPVVRAGDVAFLPAWAIEGMAVLNETDFSDGGRGRNQFFLMLAKAFILDDVPFSLGNLEYGSAYPPPGRYYLFGYLFIDFLRRTYGPNVWRDIRKRFLDFPLIGPWAAIQAVTGKHQDILWQEMQADLKTRFTSESVPLEGEPVTPPGIGDYSSFERAPFGYYFYRTRLDTSPAIVAFDPATKEERVLVEVSLYDENSFTTTADNTRLVYATVSTNGSSTTRYEAVSDLFLAALDCPKGELPRLRFLRKLTDHAHLWQPAFSPDGTRLVAVQGSGVYSRLVAVDLAMGNTRVIFSRKGTDVYNPVFSPDGTRIAFSFNIRGRQDIFIAKTDDIFEASESGSGIEDVNIDKAHPLIGPDFAGDYFPRFIDNNTVLFTSDRVGPLMLFRANVDGKRLERLLAERIAAFNGQIDGNKLIYVTYRSGGFCLKAIDTSKLSIQAVALPEAQAARAPSPRGPVASAPYIDWPIFSYWCPWGSFMSYRDQYQFDIGIYLNFASTLGTNSLDLMVLYFPALSQPDITFNFNTQIGPLNFEYTFHNYYTSYGSGSFTDKQVLGNFVTLELPLVDFTTHVFWDYVSVSTGLQYFHFLYSATPFAFLNAFNPTALANSDELDCVLGINLIHTRYDGPAAFYPAWTVINYFETTVPLPIFTGSVSGVVLLDRFSFTLPGIWNLSVWKLGLKASYTSDALGKNTYVVPRGMYPVVYQADVGRALASLDYLFTIAYTDAPLFGGLHIDGLGAGLHFETLADWNPFTPSFAFDPSFYAGAEITLLGGIGQFRIPINLGISLRFQWQPTRSFDASDVAFYFSFSFDSFFNAMDRNEPRHHPEIKARW